MCETILTDIEVNARNDNGLHLYWLAIKDTKVLFKVLKTIVYKAHFNSLSIWKYEVFIAIVKHYVELGN